MEEIYGNMEDENYNIDLTNALNNMKIAIKNHSPTVIDPAKELVTNAENFLIYHKELLRNLNNRIRSDEEHRRRGSYCTRLKKRVATR